MLFPEYTSIMQGQLLFLPMIMNQLFWHWKWPGTMLYTSKTHDSILSFAMMLAISGAVTGRMTQLVANSFSFSAEYMDFGTSYRYWKVRQAV